MLRKVNAFFREFIIVRKRVDIRYISYADIQWNLNFRSLFLLLRHKLSVRFYAHSPCAPCKPSQDHCPPLSSGNEQTGKLNNKLRWILTTAERLFAAKRASSHAEFFLRAYGIRFRNPSFSSISCTTFNIYPLIFMCLLFITKFF